MVTGGAGFIGSHLVDELLERGERVVVLDNLATGRLRNLQFAEGHERFSFVHGTVRDQLIVDELVHDADVVIHLAASTGVPQIVEYPLRSFTQNLRASETIIDAAHRYHCKLMLMSSSEVYGKNTHVPLTEDATRILGPPIATRWAYSIAKAVEEVLAYAYHRERGLDVTVVRLFSIVGPRQNPGQGAVLPRLVRQALSGDSLTVYGDGSQTRCFCHVTDAVDAIVRLVDARGATGEPYNVGAVEEVSILELARRVAGAAAPVRQRMAPGLQSELSDGQVPSIIEVMPYEQVYGPGFEDMARRVADLTKITRATGWQPRYNLDAIVEDAVADAAHELHLDEVRSVSQY